MCNLIKFDIIIAKHLYLVNLLDKIERNAPKAIKTMNVSKNILCKIFLVLEYIALGFKFLGTYGSTPFLSTFLPHTASNLFLAFFDVFYHCSKIYNIHPSPYLSISSNSNEIDR